MSKNKCTFLQGIIISIIMICFGTWQLLYLVSRIYVGPVFGEFILVNFICLPILMIIPYVCYAISYVVISMSAPGEITLSGLEFGWVEKQYIAWENVTNVEVVSRDEARLPYLIFVISSKSCVNDIEHVNLFVLYTLQCLKKRKIWKPAYHVVLYLVKMTYGDKIEILCTSINLIVMKYDLFVFEEIVKHRT